MSKKNTAQMQPTTNKKFFKKSAQSLQFYDASAMFIAQFVLQYMLQLILMILGFIIIADSLGVKMTDDDGYKLVTEKFSLFTASTGGIVLLTFLNESTMLLSPLAYCKVKSFNVFKGIGFKRKVNGGQIAMTLPTAITLLAGFMPIASLFVMLVQKTGYNYSGTNIVVDSFPKLLLYLVFVSAIPAVCEEILHRGIIARSASKFSYFVGVILSSTLFAFMHGSPMQLVHQFFVGVVCSLVYYMSGSIWISALVHFFNNAITLISGYVIYLITGSTDLTLPWWAMLLLCIFGLCGLFFSLWGMYKISYAKRKKEDKELNVDVENELNGVIRVEKKKLLKIFNEKLAYLFTTPEQIAQKRAEEAKLQEQLDEYSEEKKEVFQSLQQEDDVDLKKKNHRGVIFSIVIVLAIWIINTIAGYTS
ncbi:MAG: CPBP family intramembrane metalloprotease [Clostridia bacterium]|nr:CPBP family intramembrane metalloprotease [Clostridia bacterium]